MYFSYQPSGGRGEYEVAGTTEGMTSSDLIDHEIRLNLGSLGIKETGVYVRLRDGKRRLRSNRTPRVMIQRLVAPILLLPDTTRARTGVSNGKPIILEKRYLIDEIYFEITDLSGGVVTVAPQRLVLTSSSTHNPEFTESFDFDSRLERVLKVEESLDKFPLKVSEFLQRHAAVLQDEILGAQAEGIVRRIAEVASDEILQFCAPGTDVLPALEAYLGYGQPVVQDPPDVPEDDIELKRRFAAQIRQQKSRGASGTRFRKLVQDAYDNRCVFCGVRLPKSDVCPFPGIDAAHILPWADYDLDVVQNGLALCKLHHWAFDQQVLTLSCSNGGYSVDMPNRVRDAFSGDEKTLEELIRFLGEIPFERLPRDSSKWPRKEFLEELYRDVPPEEG